jgi:hypothetical protein
MLQAMSQTQTLASGVVIRQDFAAAVRPVFFQTEFEEFLALTSKAPVSAGVRLLLARVARWSALKAWASGLRSEAGYAKPRSPSPESLPSSCIGCGRRAQGLAASKLTVDFFSRPWPRPSTLVSGMTACPEIFGHPAMDEWWIICNDALTSYRAAAAGTASAPASR